MTTFHSARNRNDNIFRMFFFLGIFSLSSLILYIFLGKVYGYGPTVINRNDIIRNQVKNANAPISRLYPRSIKDQDDYPFEFKIIVFGWKRIESLTRLMNSLSSANYLNHSVKLEFHIDANPSIEISNYVESFNWPYGSKSMIFRNHQFGLERMVIKSWEAENDNEFVFFFEDDIEVHPKYFEYVFEIMKCNPEILKKDSDYFGIALTAPRYDEVNLNHSIWLPDMKGNKLFLFQQPCSWGALYFPWKWREFLKYYRKRRHLSKHSIDDLKIIPNSCIWDWKKSWKKYLMELMVIEAYMMIYPSLPNQESFSVHHHEEGEHFLKIEGTRPVIDYFKVPLASNEAASSLIEEIKTIDLSTLPKFSFHHFPVESIKQLKEFGDLVKENLIKTYKMLYIRIER